MRLSGILCLGLVTACSASPDNGDAPEPLATADYATVLEAPSPEYTAMLPAQPVEPQGTLRREATAPLPPNAREIGQSWIETLDARDALGGYGLDGKGADGPVSLIDTLLTERAFDALAQEYGWTVPDWITWSFVPEPVAPMVTDAAAPAIRYWPASQVRTGMQLEALFSGLVTMREGCFYVKQGDEPEKLAWFHAETGLDRDEEGYLILVDRVTGETRARIGEEMSWAGPNGIDPEDDRVHTYMQACDGDEVFNVGNPEATERMYVRYPHLRDPVTPPPPPAAQ